MADRNSVSCRQSNVEDKVPSSSWVSLSISEDCATRSLQPLCKKCSRVVNYSQEFCQKTSLHGLQYLGEQERPLPERACWILVILISIACCFVVIMKQWDKWQTSPVIVTFSETSTPAWNIPFPAVTFCSEMQFKQSTINFTELYMRHVENNITEEESKKLYYTYLLCETKMFYLPFLNGTVDGGLFEHFLNITLPAEDMIAVCSWRGAEVNCGAVFTLTITDVGVCYSFNILPANELFADDVIQANLTNNTPPTKNWSPENGYSLNKDVFETYPRRTMSAGVGAGLTVFAITQDQEADFKCRMPMEGFKMMLHNPAVFPEVKKQFFRVPSNRDVVIGVHPKIIRTTKELHSYPPKLRQCFFVHERRLRFFKIYTQENCELECLTNYTLKHCSCAQYFMPRAEGTQICGPMDIGCTIEVQEAYNFDADNLDYCNCLPACTEIKYDVEISQSGYMWEPLLKQPEWKKKRLGSFNIFLKDMHVITRKRSELYGASDFLANCGGLLGLFLGFSILSLVEIVYFLSLRLFYNVRRYRRRASKVKDNE
ncbi:pickpocket protein 28 [Anabrus simplex]|uniref:pickpocket protein 28 n=1 Tax=Anabrus simplex TaxID=316456 RepID=UPI0035A2FEBB